MLWGGNTVIASGNLVIPHPQLAQRLFVLAPLAEILPDWHHPLTGLGPFEMQQRLVGRILGGHAPQQRINKQHWQKEQGLTHSSGRPAQSDKE